MQKVIIVKSMNLTPEEELAERLAELGEGWRVTSAVTNLVPVGTMNIDEPGRLFEGVARHMYYVTTVIVERS